MTNTETKFRTWAAKQSTETLTRALREYAQDLQSSRTRPATRAAVERRMAQIETELAAR